MMSLILSLADMSDTRPLKPCIYEHVLLESYLKLQPTLGHCSNLSPFALCLLICEFDIDQNYDEKHQRGSG